jgi:RHS repeat-associated protein
MTPDQILDARVEVTSTRHDALGRAVELTLPLDGGAHRPTLTATFTRAGAMRSTALDGEDHLSLVVHNARGQRIFQAYGNGLVTRFGYDLDTFRLVRQRTEPMTVAGDVWTSTGAPLEDLTYSYDLVGNVTAIEERTAGCGLVATAYGRDELVRTFRYDGFYRLVSATGRECASIPAPRPLEDRARCGAYGPPFTGPPGAPNQANAPDLTAGYLEEYLYDPVGNLVDLHHRRTSGPAQEWHRRFGMGGMAPDGWAGAPNNRLSSLEAGGTTAVFGQDAAGHLLNENGSRSYGWDHAGRMTSFRVQAGVGTSVLARYLYGSDGQRVKKWVRRGGAATRDESVVYLGNTYERHTWAKSGGGVNALVHVTDDTARIAVVRLGPTHPDDAGPALQYELTDQLGTCAVTVDSSGGWVNREEYLPYGETSFGSFARKRYRFVGKERDEESGLSYHDARYYSPAVARWISPDPVDPGASPPRVYTYCGGRPLVTVDPDGGHPLLLVLLAAVLVNMALSNTANAPGPNDKTYPSMSEGEFAVKAGVMLASGGLGGAAEVGVAGKVGTSLGGRILAGVAGGTAGGGVCGLGTQAADDAFRGQLSTAGQYLKSTGVGMAVGAPLGALGSALSSGSATPASGGDPYIPRTEAGKPIPLDRQWQQQTQAGKSGTGIPRPDPRAGGAPHTVLGGKMSSEPGVGVYRQSATFTAEGSPTKLQGFDATGQRLPQAESVPLGRVDWTDHGHPVQQNAQGQAVHHANPHIHGYSTTGSANQPTIIEEPARGWTPPR